MGRHATYIVATYIVATYRAAAGRELGDVKHALHAVGRVPTWPIGGAQVLVGPWRREVDL